MHLPLSGVCIYTYEAGKHIYIYTHTHVYSVSVCVCARARAFVCNVIKHSVFIPCKILTLVTYQTYFTVTSERR
jgi:hypothetical protein